ncbi:hypothetical protein [Wukongibacter sp. M2B1]|uniref:hypothetical protein n=1 Tax=Wukongibacter sp. M2B1 TaxID=3088895 RepID=UPI003D7A82F6
MIYKDIELNCNEEELNAFIVSVSNKITYEIRDFAEKFNNIEIENPTNDTTAKYIVITRESTQSYLTHDPKQQGFIAITDENAAIIFEQYKQDIIDNMIFTKFAVTEADKQEQRIAELEAAMAAMMGGM